MKEYKTYTQVDEKYCTGPQQMVGDKLCNTYEIDDVVNKTYKNVVNDHLKKGTCYHKKTGQNHYIFNNDDLSIRIKMDKEDPRNHILGRVAPTRTKFVAKKIGTMAITLVVGTGVGLGAMNIFMDAHNQTIDRYQEERKEQLNSMDEDRALEILDYENISEQINSKFPDLNFYTLSGEERDSLIEDYRYNGDSVIYDYMNNTNSSKTHK